MTGLDDAFQKFERGEKHLVEFDKRIVQKFKKARIIFEIQAQPYEKPAGDPLIYWNTYTLYAAHVPVFPKEDGILLGEAIQCFRSSLDYLAWALATKHSKRALRQREKRGIQFPMSPNRKQFNQNKGKMLLNVPPEQCAFFEQYQPYRRSANGRVMRCLQILSNTDKHRIIVPTVLFPNSSVGDISCQGGGIAKTIFHLKPGAEIRKGTKILSVIVAGNTAQQTVNVDTKTVVFPMFPKTIIKQSARRDRAAPVEPILKNIRNVCFEILTKSKDYF
jgi:hypothetical protein